MKILSDAWRNLFGGMKMILYGLVIIFFVIGIIALIGGAIGLGVVLIILNGFLFLLFRRLDKNADEKFEREFDEMVKKNRGEK